MAGCGRLMRKLLRKKVFTEDDLQKTELRRCLKTLDLIGLGTGSTMGAGVYILSGQVARESAGPAVVLSFLVAGVTACLAGFCYAEFAARVPRAGSAYVYSYVTVGEFMAFIIGWNLLLEYIISVASSARALSVYVDQVADKKMQRTFEQYMPLSVPGLSAYPDFFAFSVVFLATVIVALGVKTSSLVSNVLVVINLVVIALFIIGGLTKADLHNWQLSGDELPTSGAGSGGFIPFGVSGVIAGSAVCFFAYVGFDFITTMGEETENSRKVIPVSLGATLIINLVVYCMVAVVVTLMAPYFLLDVNTPIAFVFDRVGWSPAKYVITLGALSGISSTMMTSMLPMARVMYAMANDGLIFRCFSTISSRFKTPFLSTLVSGGLAGVMTLLFDLSELVNMLSIGTLLAFGLVAVCVLILRYETEGNLITGPSEEGTVMKAPQSSACTFRLLSLFKPSSSTPTPFTARIAKISITVMCVCMLAEAALVTKCTRQIEALSVWSIVLLTLLGAVIFLSIVVIGCQPQNPQELTFKVPLVPVLPAMSCLTNIFLMLKLSSVTWIRFVVWLTIGFSVYFFYGLRHSTLNDGGSPDERTRLVRSDERHDSASKDHTPHRDLPPHGIRQNVLQHSKPSDVSVSYNANNVIKFTCKDTKQ